MIKHFDIKLRLKIKNLDLKNKLIRIINSVENNFSPVQKIYRTKSIPT